MLFAVQHGLIQVGNTPALGDIKAQQLCQLDCGGLGHCVAPGAKFGQLGACGIKRQVAVHHGRKPQRGKGCQRGAVFFFHPLGQHAVAGLNTGPHIVKVVGPHPVFIPVFPVVNAGGKRQVVVANQHRLDAGRTQFDAEYRPPFANGGSGVLFGHSGRAPLTNNFVGTIFKTNENLYVQLTPK